MRSEWIIDKVFTQKATFVLGADGHRSIVRRDIGGTDAGEEPAQVFAVFEFNAQGEEIEDARVVHHRGTTNVLWLLGDGRYRWSFEDETLKDRFDNREKAEHVRRAAVVDDT